MAYGNINMAVLYNNNGNPLSSRDSSRLAVAKKKQHHRMAWRNNITNHWQWRIVTAP